LVAEFKVKEPGSSFFIPTNLRGDSPLRRLLHWKPKRLIQYSDQAMHECAFWICDESTCKYPGLPIVILSDDVGGENMSAEIVEKWRLIISMSMCCVEDGSNSALRCGVVSGGLPGYVIFDNKSFFTSTGTNQRYKLDAKL
jgi:hypothetical protein